MWKWVSTSNSTFQMTNKTCVARNSCYIFISWFIWPDLNPDQYLALVSYWHGIFVISSIAFWQSFGLQLSLAWPRQPIRLKRVSFDIWPDLEPKFDFAKNVKIALESSCWELSIVTSRFALGLVVRKLDREGGGGGYSPLPQPMEVGSGISLVWANHM